MKNKTTLKRILAMTFTGNYFADQDELKAIHEFAMDANNPIADRAAAILFMEREAMGVESTAVETDEQIVQSYIADLE
jgi:hypothetical protein